MAEEQQDPSQKTEEPTPKKLDEARRKGQVASSREINHWFMVVASAIAVVVLGPAAMRDIARSLAKFLGSADGLPTHSAGLGAVMASTLGDLAVALLPAIAVLMVAAFASGIIQNGLLFSLERIQPKLEKISLIAGFKRLFSTKSFVEFAKGLVKIAIVGTVAAVLVVPSFRSIAGWPDTDVTAFLGILNSLVGQLFLGVAAVMTVIAVLDFLYQRHEHLKQMRMSRTELKDEMKQTEGDPHVKARLRQIRMERARQRMMAAVPDADVVITNPTHYAVALAYDPDSMTAPRLVAKGVDHMAQRIREVAEAHDVTIVEIPPLARALVAAVEIDDEIPSEHYKAVAEVISFVFRLKQRPMPA